MVNLFGVRKFIPLKDILAAEVAFQELQAKEVNEAMDKCRAEISALSCPVDFDEANEIMKRVLIPTLNQIFEPSPFERILFGRKE